MAFDFKFPDVGEGIHEGKLLKWMVKVGDEVKADQGMAEVETDKAVVEIPAPVSGKIVKLYNKEGDVLKVGDVMVTFEGEGPKAAGPTSVSEGQGVVGSLEATALGVMKAPAGFGGGAFSGGAVFMGQQPVQPTVAPVEGGSMAGVIKSGIKAVKKYDLFGYIDRAPYSGMRKTIGDHMTKSLSTAAQVTQMDTVDVTDLWSQREKAKKDAEKNGVKLSFLAYIIEKLCEALKQHPSLNAMLDESAGEIILRKYYNIGIAVDTEAGLMVPVVKGADRKDLMALSKDISDLAEKARSRKINSMDFKGGTFTITNVGSAGSTKFFTPVINHPEAAILGVGTMEDTPVVRDGKVEVRKIMYLSLSYDHRILDGAEAARFMKDLKGALERGSGTVVAEPSVKKALPKKK